MKLSIFLFFTTLTLFGQNIKGTVLDEQTNNPIENVHVYINSKKGSVTNRKGQFNLRTKITKNDTLHFSIIGYSSKKYTFSELQNANNIIYLQKKVENLKEVFVLSDKKLQPKIQYKKLASLNLGIHSFASILIDSKIYVIGGNASEEINSIKKALNDMGTNPEATVSDIIKGIQKYSTWENYNGDLQIYDIIKNTWITSELAFRERAYGALNYYNNKLYVIGGKRLSINRKKEYLDDKIEIFDIKNNSITIDNANPHQAVNFDSFTFDNNIIVMGGSLKLNKKGKKIYTNKAHIYNLESGYWYELNEMLTAKEVEGVLVENKIYLVGGFNEKPLSDIESYNISTGKWTKEGELFNKIEKPALTYNENIIYIFNNKKISTFNVITKELNQYKIDLELKASELYYYNEKIYLLGGYIENEFSKIPSSKLYSIDLIEFQKTKIKKSKNL